jgi:group I intron endonuclease
MKRYGSIYIITNITTGKQYIGQTINSVIHRFKEHCLTDRRYKSALQEAIIKYGKKNFAVDELYISFDKENLNQMEQFFIQLFNTMIPNGYNLRTGGNQNGHCSDELKAKISQSKTGKPVYCRRGEIRSREQCLKISKALNGKHILGTEIKTGIQKIYQTVNETRFDGFQPWNVVSVCKNRDGRTQHKGWKFEYIFNQVNQTGSLEENSKHGQRLEGETENVNNPSTSHR